MRVQPHLPSRPLTAIVMRNCGAAACACSAANRPAPPLPRIRMSVSYCFICEGSGIDRLAWLSLTRYRLRTNTERREHLVALRLRVLLHRRVDAAAVAIHRHEQRSELADSETPQ